VRPHKWLDLSIDRRQKLVGLAERANLARLSWGDRANQEPIVMRRPPLLVLGDAIVGPPPGAFLQSTKRGELAMRESVSAWVGDASKLADLFAGVGSLTLGGKGQLTLFESDKPSVAALDSAARKIGGSRIMAERRDLFRNPLLEKELNALDAIVLD